jgi:hypothetical protein
VSRPTGARDLGPRKRLRHHEPTIRRLNAAGQPDTVIGAALGLTANQVRGVRLRADPPIPAVAPPGRPRSTR